LELIIILNIELHGGSGNVVKKPSLEIFVTLCKNLNIKDLFVHENCIYAISPTSLISLHVWDEPFTVILDTLKKEFNLIDCHRYIDTLKTPQMVLKEISEFLLDTLKKEFNSPSIN